MEIKIILSSLAFSSLSAVSNVNAFENGDVIDFKPGEARCILDTVTYPNCYYGSLISTGSYFAMDVDGNGRFSDSEKIPLSPGSDGGIIVGQLQSATSHSLCPDGTEVSPVDSPWCFFGNSGSHQTTDTPVTDNGDGTLNFSGWGVTWNGIVNIPMGIVESNAVLTCASSPCTVGDIYEINLTSAVPANAPSNFGGVGYFLYLESNGPVIPVATINIAIAGGASQECTSEGGSKIQMSSTVTTPADDLISSIDWIVDGVNVATGSDVDVFFTLGTHNLVASVTTVNGLTAIKSTSVKVRDTSSPVVTAAFIDKYTGEVVSEATNQDGVLVKAEATDVCDPTPIVDATVGANVVNEQLIKVTKRRGKVLLDVDQLELTVTAVDASGRNAVDKANLAIVE